MTPILQKIISGVLKSKRVLIGRVIIPFVSTCGRYLSILPARLVPIDSKKLDYDLFKRPSKEQDTLHPKLGEQQ